MKYKCKFFLPSLGALWQDMGMKVKAYPEQSASLRGGISPAFHSLSPTASHANIAGHNQMCEKATNAECENSPATAKKLLAGLNQAVNLRTQVRIDDGVSSTTKPSGNSYHQCAGAVSARVQIGCNRSVLPVGVNFLHIIN